MEGGPWGGPWKESKGWSMEGVQGVVHGRGPRGGPWTGGRCFQLSPVICLIEDSSLIEDAPHLQSLFS